ncbi:hypothetical protein [Rathayibacter sp. AY1C5]|uniref:hypothetical protein n=1 Tax=Rathayibacter sp. AY1C5 TaxID=2080538 RepID=UPI0011B0936C|nr:hypothetical protein [Rathayibacter sp. AY1C5]
MDLSVLLDDVLQWWSQVEGRTSWLELIAAFLSIILSVMIALSIQGRDFRKRTAEAASAVMVAETNRTLERRQELLVRCLDLVTEAFDLCLKSADGDWRQAERLSLKLRVENAAEMIAMEGGSGAWLAGHEFRTKTLKLMKKQPVKLTSYSDKKNLNSTAMSASFSAQQIREELIKWLKSPIQHKS